MADDANTIRIEFSKPPDEPTSGGVDSSAELGPSRADLERQAGGVVDERDRVEAERDRLQAELDRRMDQGEIVSAGVSELIEQIRQLNDRLEAIESGDFLPDVPGLDEVSLTPKPEAGPQPVELTPENAKLLADLLGGKITEEEFEAGIGGAGRPPTGPPAPPTSPGEGPKFPEARRIPTAQPIIPEGGEADIQDELQRQHDAEKRRQEREEAKRQREQDELQRDLERQAKEQEQQKLDEERAGREKARTIAGGAQTIAQGGGSTGSVVSGALQIATTGAFGAELATLAAGPVGVAIAAAAVINDAAIQKIHETGQKVREQLTAVGDALGNLAENDLPAIRDQVAETSAQFVERFGIAGTYLAEEIRTINAVVQTGERVLASFVKRGQELAQYDARLATAGAEADVARLQADLREAEKTGEDLSRLTRSSSQIEQYQRELLLLVKSEVISLLADLLEPVGEVASDLKPIAKAIGDINDSTKDVRRLGRAFMTGGIIGLLRRMVEFFDDPGKAIFGGGQAPANALLEDVFNVGKDIPIGSVINQTFPTAPQPGQMGVPTWFREAN